MAFTAHIDFQLHTCSSTCSQQLQLRVVLRAAHAAVNTTPVKCVQVGVTHTAHVSTDLNLNALISSYSALCPIGLFNVRTVLICLIILIVILHRVLFLSWSLQESLISPCGSLVGSPTSWYNLRSPTGSYEPRAWIYLSHAWKPSSPYLGEKVLLYMHDIHIGLYSGSIRRNVQVKMNADFTKRRWLQDSEPITPSWLVIGL